MLGLWQDASGAEDAYFFQKPSGTDPWQGGPVVDDDAPSGMHGTLLQNKRQREQARDATTPEPASPSDPLTSTGTTDPCDRPFPCWRP